MEEEDAMALVEKDEDEDEEEEEEGDEARALDRAVSLLQKECEGLRRRRRREVGRGLLVSLWM